MAKNLWFECSETERQFEHAELTTADVTTRREAAMATEEFREIHVYAYETWPDLYIFRCPSCGSTGPRGSWCAGHDAPMAMGVESLRVKREPVEVPQAEPDRPVTEGVYRSDTNDQEQSRG